MTVRKDFSVGIAPPTTFQVYENNQSDMVQQMTCYVQSGPDKGRQIYSFCNRLGHIAEICFKKHGFPPVFTPKGKQFQKFQHVPAHKSQHVAAQVALSTLPESKSDGFDTLGGNLYKDQIQHFIAYFSSQL